ncbi:Cupredoxin [Hyaloraphidium curvatum]|nr:Cupredoxin [Hyaloraphidium curvatum]
MVYLFNIAAFFILFRETLEAAIIVGVLLNYIKKTLPHEPVTAARLRRQVWLGSGTGLGISVIIGVVFCVVFYVLKTDVFGSMEALWEGIMKTIAVVLITWMAFAMLRAKNWYQHWEEKLEAKLALQAEKDAAVVEKGKATVKEPVADADDKVALATGGSTTVVTTADGAVGIKVDPETQARSSLSSDGTTAVPSENLPDYRGGISTRPYAMFLIAFTVVLREGLESVIFLAGVGQGEPFAMILPGVTGIILGFAVGYIIFRSARHFRLQLFLLISAIFLFFIAAGLAAGAAHEFEEIVSIKNNEAAYAEWDANAPQNLTVAESPANTWKALRVRDVSSPQLHERQEESVQVAWSPPLREVVESSLCPAVNASSPAPSSCAQRTYYIAAEIVTWDYAPSGYNHINGVPFIRDPEGAGVFTLHGEGRIGAVYDRIMFVEYEDASFTRKKAQEGPWLGFLGPVIRAEVGDIVKINFLNRSPNITSMHPHGLQYVMESEGATVEWNDIGNRIEPNATYVYTWVARDTSGPAAGDGNAVLWAYHSHVHEVRDIFTGMLGPLIVYAPGTLDKTTDKPTDVDREYAVALMVADENQSLMLEHNIAKYAPEVLNDPSVWEADEFIESNLMHSINGRMYNNLDGLEMVVGQRVRWMTFAFGNEVDLHTAHWHGNTLVEAGTSRRTDVIPLLPASFHVATMTANEPGQWLFHCHVSDHIHAGMMVSYHVKANATQPDITWTIAMADKEFVPELPESSQVLWDLTACCSEESNAFFQIMNVSRHSAYPVDRV